MWIAVLNEDIKTDMKVFDGKSTIISDIINRHLALTKFKIPGVKKITISLTSEKNVNFISGPIKGFSSVINIRKSFDVDLFNSSIEDEQNEMILNLIETNLQEAAEKLNWDSSRIREITNEVRKLKFKNCYLEWNVKVSKDKKNKAGVEVQMLVEEAIISIVFFSSDNALIRRVKLISVRPNRFFIKPLMGLAKWVTHTDFELVDKKNEMHFRASLLKETAEVYFTPINRDSNKVIDDLLILSVSTRDELAISLLHEKLGDK